VHTIPDPFATSIAAAYSTTCTRSSATSAPSPPCAVTAPPGAPSFAFFFPADIAASLSLRNQQEPGCPGSGAGEEPNLIGVLEATVPQPA
jgi:hypothetical protein